MDRIIIIVVNIIFTMITRCVKLPSLESGNVDAEQCTVGLGQPQCQMVMMWCGEVSGDGK